MAYEEFTVVSSFDKTTYRCRFHTLATGISPRHSDTVDVKFLLNGKGVVIALPHAALSEYRQRSGRVLTDADTIQMAGLFLKELLERGEPVEGPFLLVPPDEAVRLAGRVNSPVGGRAGDFPSARAFS